MTIPPLPQRLASLPAKTVTAIESYGQAAYRSGVQYGMGQAAHFIQMRLTEARNEPVPDKADVPLKPKSHVCSDSGEGWCPICVQEEGNPLKEFFMTIGVGYEDGSHPLKLSPHGYVVIEAVGYEKARMKAFELTLGKFAFLYEKAPESKHFPLGELMRVRAS